MKLLFFGREECHYSHLLRFMLQDLSAEVTCVLSGQKPELDVLEGLSEWTGDYIVSFRSRVILPPWLLQRANSCAVNFHPGPPEYPGSGCVNWALYDERSEYGVTAHLMDARVDSGAILRVHRFPIAPHHSVADVLLRTHAELFLLAHSFLSFIRTSPADELYAWATSSDERWSGSPRPLSSLDALQTIDPVSISPQELSRVIRATKFGPYGPRIVLHGVNFVLPS